MRTRMLIGMAAAMICGPVASAKWATPTEMPIDRVVANLTKAVEEHPKDASAWYALGRARSFAFVYGVESIGIHQWGNEETGITTRLPDDWEERYWIDFWKRDGKAVKLTEARGLEEVAGAIAALERAIELDAAHPEFHLTLAYTLEKGIDVARKCEVVPPGAAGESDGSHTKEFAALIDTAASRDAEAARGARAELGSRILELGAALSAHRNDAREGVCAVVDDLLSVYWRERAIQEYLVAFRGAFPEEVKQDEQPLMGLCGLVSHEAGESFLHMVNESPSTVASNAQAKREVAEGMKRLEHIPPCMAITPVIIATRSGVRLRDVVDSHASVAFDLAGDEDRGARWSWPTPDAGILVWDPKGTGRITSGRQMFGPATWWMLFSDGYAALSALDDDRDGWVRGAELDGIAVWFDLDSDGVSDAGEVVPVREIGVTGIACGSTGVEDGCMANRAGVEWGDGMRMASWDWVAERRGE